MHLTVMRQVVSLAVKSNPLLRNSRVVWMYRLNQTLRKVYNVIVVHVRVHLKDNHD